MNSHDATGSPPPARWSPREYEAASAFQSPPWAPAFDRHSWASVRNVLDAGCGSGRLLPALLERVPQGQIWAVDNDPAMLEEARHKLKQLAGGERVHLAHCDLLALPNRVLRGEGDLPRPESIDRILSNSVFHFISSKLDLYKGLHLLLKAGGRLTARLHGEGSLRKVHAAAYRAARDLGLQEVLHQSWAELSIPAAEDTREQLKACGYRQVQVWEEPTPAELPDREAYLKFAGALFLRPFRLTVTPQQWEAFEAEFAAQSYALQGGWIADIVRQYIEAVR